MNVSRTILRLAVLAAILVTAAATAAEPAKTNKGATQRVEVTIEGIGAATFTEISGLSLEVEVIEYREGGDTGTVRKLPGRVKYPNVVLKRGMTSNNALWNWMQKSAAGVPDPRKVTIAVYGAERLPIRTYTLKSGWPCKWELSSLDASGNQVTLETLTLAHEGLELVE